MKYWILAYGSLIDDPWQEIKKYLEGIIDNIETPFNVEFARSSSWRCGAPTLVPYEKWEKVIWKILVLKDWISENEVRNILYRRELNQVWNKEKIFDKKNILNLENCYDNKTKFTCKIIELENFAKLDKVFITSFSANIENLSAEKLSELATKSFENEDCRKEKRDWINYLFYAKNFWIKTKLSEDYKKEILKKLWKNSLEEIIMFRKNNI